MNAKELKNLRNQLVHYGQAYWKNACWMGEEHIPFPTIKAKYLGKLNVADSFMSYRLQYIACPVLGYYWPKKHEVCINLDWALQLPRTYVLHALLPHELGHAYAETLFPDVDHGREWRHICRLLFDVIRPEGDAGDRSWDELSTLFDPKPEGDLDEVNTNDCRVDARTLVLELDETFYIENYWPHFLDDYGDDVDGGKSGELSWTRRAGNGRSNLSVPYHNHKDALCITEKLIY